ncbi:universal stress protein [Geodermatophilus sp. DF01-2]|uniref:universal stress protein n=1 Tax=Geodermatophilus sp. DF01-2 TaxID=2559610 RepID=UPI00107393B5|nr:universal stress protein [Geodermatophilus sp. DF01_2]TFV57751.1 universal stress protein [Geodermatophilus sp. DF01_2]
MTVLVAYVPTPEGDAAFTAAVAEAVRRRERLVLLNTPRQGAPVSAAMADEETVRALLDRASAADVEVEVRQEAHTGDLADEVVRVAAAVDASVVVIGLRRRSPVGKLLMGSTAQRILLDADRPVLAVKPNAVADRRHRNTADR